MVLRKAFRYSVLLVCALCVLLALPVFGQRITGDIAGNVTDSSGAVVPNATVTAENLGTNEQRNINTTESGGYRIPDLAIGQYKVTVTAQGFKTSVQNVQVLSGALINADFRLQIGQRTETVEVEGAAHYLPAYAGNLDIMTSAALRTAERLAAHRSGEEAAR